MQTVKKLPPLEELDKVITYDPLTGLFTRLKNGAVVGVSRNPGQYVTIGVLGREYFAHRLAWYLYHRKPIRDGYQIDHLNGKKDDNRIENLRELNKWQNAKSRALGNGLRFFVNGQEWV